MPIFQTRFGSRSCFRVKNLPRFLHRFLFGSQDPSSVRFSVFMRSQESSLIFPRYSRFLSTFLDFLVFFCSVFLETLLVYFQVYFKSQEPSSVRFSVYVTVYFSEYKYRPYDSIIGLFRLAITKTAQNNKPSNIQSGSYQSPSETKSEFWNNPLAL